MVTAKKLLGVSENQTILVDPVKAADGIVRLGLNTSDNLLGLPIHYDQYDLAIELCSGRYSLARGGECNIEVVTVL